MNNPGETGGRKLKLISSPEGAGHVITISDGYFQLYIYSALSELGIVGGLPTSGFTGGYSYIAAMRREVPLGQPKYLKNGP